jgi:hypothetical protein
MSLSDRAKLAAKNLNNNLLALGLKLTPQAAKNVYIKEGYNPEQLALQGGLGTMANVSELMPGVGPIGKAVTTFAGPAIRAGQDIAEGKDKKLDAMLTAVHEAGHVILTTYNNIEDKICSDDTKQEPFCYYLEWITKCIYTTMSKK